MPSASPFPARPPRLANPVAGLARRFLLAALLILLAPTPLFLFTLSPDLILLPCVLAFFLALSMAIASTALAFYARSVARRLRRFHQGDFLLCWTYTPEEWERFARSEQRHTVRVGRQPPWLGLFLGALPGATLGGSLGWVFFQDLSLTLVLGLLGALALGGLGAGLEALLRAFLRWTAGRTARRVLASPRVAYVGADAAYCAGLFWNWKALNTWLGDLRLIEDDPGALEFTVCTHVHNGTVEHRFRIPLPYAAHAEALALLQKLKPGR